MAPVGVRSGLGRQGAGPFTGLASLLKAANHGRVKAKELVWTLLLLLLGPAACSPPEELAGADRKEFKETKAKAEKGDAKAQYSLGTYYRHGKGGTRDSVEAAKWTRKAAEQGHATAQFILGVCYRDGDGVTKDAVEAAGWYRKAAEQGYAEAQFFLAASCRYGNGVVKDTVEAGTWYRKAAEQGHGDSQYDLGLCYARGEGMAPDYVEAHKWLSLASVQGDHGAKKYLSQIETKMTPEQIAEAQQRVREFKPRKALEPAAAPSGQPPKP